MEKAPSPVDDSNAIFKNDFLLKISDFLTGPLVILTTGLF